MEEAASSSNAFLVEHDDDDLPPILEPEELPSNAVHRRSSRKETSCSIPKLKPVILDSFKVDQDDDYFINPAELLPGCSLTGFSSDGEDVVDPDDPDASDSDSEEKEMISSLKEKPSRRTSARGRGCPRKRPTPSLASVTSWLKNEPSAAKRGRGRPSYPESIEEEDTGIKSPDGCPVFSCQLLSFSAAEQLLLADESAHEGRGSVCCSIPMYCPFLRGSFTFLIDANALNKLEDLPVDGYGSWTSARSNASTRNRYYSCQENGELLRTEATRFTEPEQWDFKITQTRYIHPASNRFFRKFIYSVRLSDGTPKRWAAICYQWLSEPFPFTPLPHGNCRKDRGRLKPFQRTYPSVLAAMKEQLPEKMPKHVYSDVVTSQGVGSLPSPAVPRDTKQLYNLSREVNKDVETKVDHRRWRKTGPQAGLPPSAQLDEEPLTFIIHSNIPGLPDEELDRMRREGEWLSESGSVRVVPGNRHWATVVDSSGGFAVRQEPGDPGLFSCSGCPEWSQHRVICRHTVATAQHKNRLQELLEWVRMTKSSRPPVTVTLRRLDST